VLIRDPITLIILHIIDVIYGESKGGLDSHFSKSVYKAELGFRLI
jgi:hypothetical protein